MIIKKFLLGIIFVFIGGSLLHFTFGWSNNNFWVGLFSAQNESVFEHTKLLVLPTFIWFLLSYSIWKTNIDKDKYFSAMLVSLFTSILTIPLLYYTYKIGFNINTSLINIVNFFVSTMFGQLLAYHYYKYGDFIPSKIIRITLSFIVIGTYIYFSINQPNLPFFVAS